MTCDGELKLALEALTDSIPIITSTEVANAKAGKYIIAYIDCDCWRRSEQRQRSQSRTTLLDHSLRALIEDKHANCIAERAVSSAAAAAAAAQKESLAGTFFGTMMDAAAARATSERRAAELLAAHALVKSSKLTATAAEERAEAARRAEVEAAAAFLAPRNAAEKEATELAVVADAARHALSELQGDEKRARVAIVSAKQTRQQHVHREDQRATHVEGLDCLQKGRLRHLGRMVPSCRHRRDGPLLLQARRSLL